MPHWRELFSKSFKKEGQQIVQACCFVSLYAFKHLSYSVWFWHNSVLVHIKNYII